MEDKIIKILSEEHFLSTWGLAYQLKMRGKTSTVLRKMKRLEKDNKVKRHSYSMNNNIVWELV